MSELQQFGPPRQVVSSIYEIAPDALEQICQYIEQRGLRTPISQVIGFQQFEAQLAADVLTSETTTSATYTDLATVGPSLNTLGDGKYLLFFGFTNPATLGLMSVSVNGSGGSDATSAQAGTSATNFSVMRATAVTLGSGTNTVVAKYRTGGATSTFANRWLLAMRYGTVR